MLAARKAVTVWLFLAFERVLTAQTPLLSHTSPSFYPVENDLGQWDLDKAPAVNATGHLVFDTANSLLQHWANTRYRIGHTIVPGTVPVGTLLYHGASGPHIPTALDWVAVEPDHSLVFCKGSIETGCWHLTLAVTQPMKVLYFDGSSAAKLLEGTMDTQDLVAWSKMKPEWVWNEKQRIKDLCKWGQKYGLNGFVRMEVNFEIMICDFTSHMEVVSFLNMESIRYRKRSPTAMPEDPTTMHHVFAIMHSASWRANYPGETRIILDFSGLVSFYDTALVPSLVPRRVGLERWDHRVEGISSEDIERVQDRLAQALVRPPVTTSGIDWKTVLRVVVDRYASRLDFMQYLLNMTLDDKSIFDHAQQIQRRLRTVLLPYTLFSALPPNTSVTANTTNLWAAPIFRECATSHTASIVARGTTLMPSERLLMQAVQETTHEICRVATKMWASGMIIGVDPLYPPEQRPEADHIHALMGEWKEDLTRLISCLDWSAWVTCRPACDFEEMCYLPTWPYGFFPTPGEPHQVPRNSASLWPDPNKGEWKRPQPKCIRRREPYNF
ncbi:uncharacterized protein F5891DRAFT_111912 [Suillus fuscotomentosus]|uniref:Uncharacterized protein n=1 Tax=Suillus fuscotomentosus TaxID=1912939 RepID=A0AAD4EBA5_9AGAM|nr:uncharacterized protein F5891DRAFT_111912 [Suillus fuscotomentosus]KAG1903005.1 hypothetical protein F5891DRAFT_111912 [Suillus fuscotomentosus]